MSDYDDRCDDEAREGRREAYLHNCRMKDLRDGIPPWMWSGADEEEED